MEFVVPLCSYGGLEEAVAMVREGAAMVAGRGPGGFEERPVEVARLAEVLRPYMELYDDFLMELAAVFGARYAPADRGDVLGWLRSHVSAVESVGARWARVADRLGPFSVRRQVDKVYLPYIGRSLTLSYVAYPFSGAVVAVENRGKSMAIGSVEVLWGGVRVVAVGLRTLAGAVVLSQGAGELAEELGGVKKSLERFVEGFRSIWRCP